MNRLAIALALACSCSVAALAAEQAPKAKASAAAAAAKLAESGKLSLTGNPTLLACVGGIHYNAHSLGYVVRGTRIKVDFQSGETIDPIASVMITQMGPNAPNGIRAGHAYDDDSGGGSDPRLETTAAFDGNVIVYVGSYDGAHGCYAMKVEIVVP